MLTGNDLIVLGLRPGKHSKDILAHANAHGLAGEALDTYVALFRAPALLPLRPASLAFQENIRASSAVEQQNIDYVRPSMQFIRTALPRAKAPAPPAP